MNYKDKFKHLIKREAVFSAQKAITQGSCKDSRGKVHKIIASTRSYIITERDDMERCFTYSGYQVSNFPETKLIQPICVRNSYPHYWFYNPDTMELLWMDDHKYNPADAPMYIEHPNMVCINHTHPSNHDLIASWGFIETSWLSD